MLKQLIKLTLLLVILMVVTGTVFCQPSPCSDLNPDMTPTCAEACIICDIDGFTGRHESVVEGSLPDGFCTTRVHNAQWIAFQAASVNLQIRLTVSNCQQNRGLEMTIYKSISCDVFEEITECDTDVGPGESVIFTNNQPLLIGQYYFIAMDGSNGDNCDWLFEVIEGSTQVDELTTTSEIIGEEKICASQLFTYFTDPESGAVLFDWSLNGSLIQEGPEPSINLNLIDDGTYELCVQAKNACDEASPTCKTIEVYTIPPTEIHEVFCGDDCYNIHDFTYCDEGTYQHKIPAINGCDSTIILHLTKIDIYDIKIEQGLCENEVIYLGDTPITEAGEYTDTLVSSTFCDSIVSLTLKSIICDIQTAQLSTSVQCYGENSGSVEFEITQGTPPFTYQWSHLTEGINGNGTIADLNIYETINNLPVGNISIIIEDEYGNSQIIEENITEPEQLIINSDIVEYNGYNLSCYDSSNGQITLAFSGGNSPYEIMWSNGSTAATIDNLSSGSYSVEIMDISGCITEATYDIIAPTQILPSLQYIDPTCNGPETGVISLEDISGGTAPFLYSINGGPFIEEYRFESLIGGDYTIEIIDANGCSTEDSGTLVTPQIPDISGKTSYSVDLGDEIQIITSSNNIDIREIIWDNTELSCTDCLTPYVTPLHDDIYTLIITSEDGCIDSLQIRIDVEKDRTFYAPNIFDSNASQNGNTVFNLFGNKAIGTIDMIIFDRWGNKMYEADAMDPISPTNPWDGTYNGQQVAQGVYTWIANIHYIDNETIIYSGDVTFLR